MTRMFVLVVISVFIFGCQRREHPVASQHSIMAATVRGSDRNRLVVIFEFLVYVREGANGLAKG